jgi:hypothetical protein
VIYGKIFVQRVQHFYKNALQKLISPHVIIQVNVAQQHFYNHSWILKIKKAGFKKKL